MVMSGKLNRNQPNEFWHLKKYLMHFSMLLMLRELIVKSKYWNSSSTPTLSKYTRQSGQITTRMSISSSSTWKLIYITSFLKGFSRMFTSVSSSINLLKPLSISTQGLSYTEILNLPTFLSIQIVPSNSAILVLWGHWNLIVSQQLSLPRE